MLAHRPVSSYSFTMTEAHGEHLPEILDHLEFSDLRDGDVIHMTIGSDDDAWALVFTVESADSWPTGVLSATAPDGSQPEPVRFTLHGCGRWTTRAQNPVQTQDRAFTPYYDGLVEGSYLWGVRTEEPGRIAFDNPGQEITAISVDKAS